MTLFTRILSTLAFAASGVVVAHCGGADPGADEAGSSVSAAGQELSGCHGKAASSVPASGKYFLTSFGFSASDDGLMSCGSTTRHGTWYYAASRQRYGCGARIRIEAKGKCVVAQTDDYGPDVCVENAAGMPIIDASPLVSEHLFGVKSAGYSDRLAIQVSQVSASTPLGPCDSSAPPPPPPVATCHSATLGTDVSLATCVQAASDRVWYQCTEAGWKSGGATGSGPLGACTSSHPL